MDKAFDELLEEMVGRLHTEDGLVERPALPVILQECVPGEQAYDIRRALIRIIGRRVLVQDSRTGAQIFGRALTKQIEAHCEAECNGLTFAERSEIVCRLVDGACRELLLATAQLHDFGQAALDCIEARDSKNTVALAQARTARLKLSEGFKNTLTNACRAVVGEAIIQ
jgi:hypothetical protein